MKLPLLRNGGVWRKLLLYLGALAALVVTIIQLVKGDYQKATFYLLLTFWLEYTADV